MIHMYINIGKNVKINQESIVFLYLGANTKLRIMSRNLNLPVKPIEIIKQKCFDA